jgi:hypothetical protein
MVLPPLIGCGWLFLCNPGFLFPLRVDLGQAQSGTRD